MGLVHTITFSFHCGLGSCLHGNASLYIAVVSPFILYPFRGIAAQSAR